MKKKIIQTDRAPNPVGPYSQGVVAGDFLFISGQVSLDPSTGKITGETIEEQTKVTLENTKAIIEKSGASLADVVKVTAVLNDMNDFKAFNSVYQTYFPSNQPARICYGGSLLAAGKLLLEIDAIVFKPK